MSKITDGLESKKSHPKDFHRSHPRPHPSSRPTRFGPHGGAPGAQGTALAAAAGASAVGLGNATAQSGGRLGEMGILLGDHGKMGIC